MLQKCYMKDIGEYKDNKKSFKHKKENIIKSLKEVECFLCNWKKVSKGIRLYKILK